MLTTCKRHIIGRVGTIFLAFGLLVLIACQPAPPEMIVVTEVVQLGEEQIIITRLIEALPTATPTAPPPQAVPEPVTLDIAYEDSLPDLDPQHVSDRVSLDVAESLYAGLTNFNHETQQIEPELAESWRISGDGLTWTFLLRDDISWVRPLEAPVDPNNIPEPDIFRAVDAEDFAYSFRRACTQSNGVPDAFLLFIVSGCEAVYTVPDPGEQELELIGVEALDDRTLQVTLTEASSQFLTITSLPQFRPVPRDLVEEHGSRWRDAAGEIADGWQTPETLVVSGPFVPGASPFSDTELVLYRNQAWSLPPRGNVDQINIEFELAQSDIFARWQARELDLSILPPEERTAVLEQSPSKALLITNQTVFYLGFNFDSTVFREAEVRRAFSSAVNRSELVQAMFEGRGLELRHFTPPGVFGAPPVAEVGVGYSPDFALQQMDRSSLRSCKLIPPVLLLVSTADLSLLQAELIRGMWINELGCDEELIQIEQVDFGMLLARTTSDSSEVRPDMWELAWPAYYPDAHNLLTDLLHCTDGENRQNRPCDDADRLLRQARLTPNLEERTALYRQVENLFFTETGSFPLIPLYVRGDYLLAQNWLTFPPALSGGEQFDTYRVDQELKRLERSRS